MASTINASTSAGLVSTADTSGVLQLQTAGTTAVSIDASQAVTFSAGTANGVSYLNGSKVLTTGSVLVFDGTNLGIGTSTPATKLDVSYTAAAGNIVHIAGANNVNGYIGAHASDNGGLYINSNQANQDLRFRTQNTDRATIDASGNLGLGVTPSAWGPSTLRAMQFGPSGALFSSTVANAYISSNTYYDGTNFRYINTQPATSYAQNNGVGNHVWYTAPSGTAGNAITFTQAMTLDASGNLGIGTTSPNASAILDAQSTTKGVRMPNMTTTQKNAISSPAAGLMVFDTTLAKLCVYSGSAWQTITSV